MTRRERIKKYNILKGGSRLRPMQRVAIALMIAAMTVSLYFICFAGRTPINFQMNMGMRAQARIVSSMTFEYPSEIRTKAAKDRAAGMVPISCVITKLNEDSLGANLSKLIELLNKRQVQAENLALRKPADPAKPEAGEEEKPLEEKNLAAMSDEDFINLIKKSTGFNINEADLPSIMAETTLTNRQQSFWLVLTPLKEIVNEGIYDDSDPVFSTSGSVYDFGGGRKYRRSQTEARRELKKRIEELGISDTLSGALYRIFNSELRPNIVYNEAQTQKYRDEARAKVKPVMVLVTEGETIMEPGRKLTPLETERLNAYIKESEKNQNLNSPVSNAIREVSICLLLMFAASLFFIISKNHRNHRKRSIALFATLLIFNMLLERGVIQLSDSMGRSENLITIFVYGAPIMIGPILQVLLCTAYTAFVIALISAILTTIMLGFAPDYFVLLFSSILLAIFYCNGARTRKQVITAGLLYGIILSVFSVIIGTSYDLSAELLWKQGAIAMLSGIMTGIVATVVIPVFEKIFKLTSNLTLLEYTDYNNPLLRMLQMDAPGTFHHSLMVSQIAEQAAVKIGANPLECAVGGLYHDIGKLLKPEFFAENQAAANPHDAQNPSMSALIIKSHLREGVDLARKYKMPPVVTDAILQHHGNSVISYFYNKALNFAGANASKEELMQAMRNCGIEEADFRHEGKKPQTPETAILMLADSCEAASRSLKRVTPHSIEELVDKIFKAKMSDHQLDESSITLKQLANVRESIIFTLKNMLHSRVEYNTPPPAMNGEKSGETEKK